MKVEVHKGDESDKTCKKRTFGEIKQMCLDILLGLYNKNPVERKDE